MATPAPSQPPVSDCADSPLSLVSSTLSILTFLTAITLSIQLSLASTSRLTSQIDTLRTRRIALSTALDDTWYAFKPLLLLPQDQKPAWYRKQWQERDKMSLRARDGVIERLGRWELEVQELKGKVSPRWEGWWRRVGRTIAWVTYGRFRAEKKVDGLGREMEDLWREYELYCGLTKEPKGHKPDLADCVERVLNELAELKGQVVEILSSNHGVVDKKLMNQLGTVGRKPITRRASL